MSVHVEKKGLEPEGDGPMGPSRMVLSKPVVAAIAGHARLQPCPHLGEPGAKREVRKSLSGSRRGAGSPSTGC